jgi:hypothetical protein
MHTFVEMAQTDAWQQATVDVGEKEGNEERMKKGARGAGGRQRKTGRRGATRRGRGGRGKEKKALTESGETSRDIQSEMV